MKVQYGPLVSDARGRFGGMVASAWRGTRMVRRFRAPKNPKTALQVEVRRIFINCMRCWQRQTTTVRAAWLAYAVGKNFVGRNHFVGAQVPVLKGKTNLNDYVGTPGDAGTLGAASITVTPSAATLTVVFNSVPTIAGWTVTKAVAYVLQDSDWGAVAPIVFQFEGEDVTSPYSVALTPLAAVLYQVRGFLVWLAPDGTTRYSISAPATGTPT